MALQEMPEQSENEIEEPTEVQEESDVSPTVDSDENVPSEDSSSLNVPVDEVPSSDDSEESDTADQSTPEADPAPEQPDAPEASSDLDPEESDTADQSAPEADSAPEQPDASEASSDLDPEGSAWYVIHCYSGYENKVRHNLEQRIETMGMKDRIFDVVIPTQEEIEVKDGKRRTVERHIFPGYVLVNLELSEESWYVVRNTPGVTGFVGMGNTPTALRPEEVSQIIKRMEADAPTVNVTYKVGERVRIIDGPFNDFRGVVSEIDMERTKVRVNVSFFGRETPVELDFLQVEKS